MREINTQLRLINIEVEKLLKEPAPERRKQELQEMGKVLHQFNKLYKEYRSKRNEPERNRNIRS